MKFNDFWDCDHDGNYTHEEYHLVRITADEHKRFYSTFEFPIISLTGYQHWFNKYGEYHRVDGPAFIGMVSGRGASSGKTGLFTYSNYWLDGVFFPNKEQWLEEVRKILKRFYFLREKIICLQKLTEIPELYQEVYYAHKKQFLALLRKI